MRMKTQLSRSNLDELILPFVSDELSSFEKLRLRKNSENGFSGRCGKGRIWKTRAKEKKLKEAIKRGKNKAKFKQDVLNLKFVDIFAGGKKYLITTHTNVPSNTRNVIELPVSVKYYELNDNLASEIRIPKNNNHIFFHDLREIYSELTTNFFKQGYLNSTKDFRSIIRKSITELLYSIENKQTPIVYKSGNISTDFFWLDSTTGKISKREGDLVLEARTHHEFLFLPKYKENNIVFNRFNNSNLVTNLYVEDAKLPLDTFYNPIRIPKPYLRRLNMLTKDQRAKYIERFGSLIPQIINEELQKEISTRIKQRYLLK